MIDSFFKTLEIPESCRLDKKLFKKLFFENARMNTSEKKIFSSDISSIIWMYTLKNDTVNIKPYIDDDREYVEIAIIKAQLNEKKQHIKISEVIQRAIPYPVVLFLVNGTQICINTAPKRINKADKEKFTIEEYFYSDWIDLKTQEEIEQQFLENLNVKKFSFENFYHFYCDLTDRIIALNSARLTGTLSIKGGRESVERKVILDEIIELQANVKKLKNLIKKESQFHRQVEMNVEIKQNQSRIEDLKIHL